MVRSQNSGNSRQELNSMKEFQYRKYNKRMSLFRWIMLDVIYIAVWNLVRQLPENAHFMIRARKHKWKRKKKKNWEKKKLLSLCCISKTYAKLIPLLHQMIVAMCARLNHTAWIFRPEISSKTRTCNGMIHNLYIWFFVEKTRNENVVLQFYRDRAGRGCVSLNIGKYGLFLSRASFGSTVLISSKLPRLYSSPHT